MVRRLAKRPNGSSSTGAPPPLPGQTLTGLHRVISETDPRVLGPRIGLLTHPAAVLPDLTHSLEALLAAGADIRALFGSEHGFRGTAQAGYSETPATDPATGLPVFDTYDADIPTLAAHLRAADIDTLVVDLQHAGARFYTYESTLYDILVAADNAGVEIVVLDRPNPIGGVAVQGPVLDPAFASFVGRAPIPLRHAMTIGELGGLFADLLGVARPHVVTMLGWRRTQLFADTGLPWVPPSPNMPTPSTALVYPGTCLVEGTTMSCGRGSTTPFELVGAPWLDGSLARALRSAGLPGVGFRQAYFTPAFDVHSGKRCCGVQFHVNDPAVFDPLLGGLTLLAAARELGAGGFAFRERFFDLLAGTDRLRGALESGARPAQIVASWQPELREFAAAREGHLRYPPG